MADDDIRTQLARDPEMERAKQWWRENGRAIVAGVALGLAGVVGFNVWQGHQQSRAENASNLYQQLRVAVVAADAAAADADTDAADDTDTDAADTDDTDTVTDDTDTTDAAIAAAQIQTLADQLMNDFAATPYALHAALALAKQRVAADDLAAAADALRWAVDNADDGLRHIARLRLASVLLAQDDAAAALALLAVDDTGGFAARYSELTGDAHLQTGDTVSARDAYNKSLQAGGGALLKLKLDNL